MEVVQDFVNAPSLEKFKNISSPQRKSLLAEYFKVCNLAEIWYMIVYWIIALLVNPEITCDQMFFQITEAKKKNLAQVNPESKFQSTFPTLGTCFMFSRALLCLNVFQHFAVFTCFLALDFGSMFSYAWHWVHVFPRLVVNTYYFVL